MMQCTSGPGGACYRAIEIVSGAAGGLVFELLIADKDGPFYQAGTGMARGVTRTGKSTLLFGGFG
jgi:hypothetical protein